MNQIKLYVKTHNKTGLKYFGYTTQKDVQAYRGSGLYWLRHLKEHGHDVQTTIIASFDNIEAAREFSLKFSEENNIVKSSNWANLAEETCSVGVPKGYKFSVESCERRSVARTGLKRAPHSQETKDKMSRAKQGRKLPIEQCVKISERLTGKVCSEETRRKIGTSNSKKVRTKEFIDFLSKQWLVVDPNGKEQIITNMRAFCKARNLCASSMTHVASGKRNHHHGYKCKRLEDA